jgi:hypothetical protein
MHDRREHPLGHRRRGPGVDEAHARTVAGQRLELVGAACAAAAAGADVVLDDLDRPRAGDGLDGERIALAGHLGAHLRDGSDAPLWTGVLPVGEHVVGERFVVAHHVEEGEDALAWLGHVD